MTLKIIVVPLWKIKRKDFRVRARIDANFRHVLNTGINQKNKAYFTNGKYGYIDSQSTYRVVKMMARHWKTDVKTAYRRYADWVVTGVAPSLEDAKYIEKTAQTAAKGGSNG